MTTDRPITPLNGQKTHPMSDFALAAMQRLRGGPMPSQEFNPGVLNRLQREAYVEYVMLPSPYKSHRGQNINHVRLTPAGEAFCSAPRAK